MASRLNQSGLLFVPRGWQRAKVLQWLKRVHAWTGFWGALLFLVLGASGVLLNHRNILKIDTGEPVEASAVDIAVPPGSIPNADALGAWAKRELRLPVEGKPPPPAPPADAAPRAFGGVPVAEPEKWTRVFTLTGAKVTVEHVPGAAHVSARRETVGALAFLKNVHKGTGLGVAWILFIDTIAGALITISLTGFLLWSRLHGSRLIAGGIVLASLALAIGGFLPALA